MPAAIFCSVMAASYARKKDLELTTARVNHVKNLQRCYLKLISVLDSHLMKYGTIQERSTVINHRHRITGERNGFDHRRMFVVKTKMNKGLQEAFDTFIESQVLVPGKWQPVRTELLKDDTLKSHLLVRIQANLEQY